VSTVFERIGGSGAMTTAVELFYTKVLGDATLAPFFEDVPMARQREKMTALLTSVTGGPATYGGRDMRTAHAPLLAMGLDDAHFDAVVVHLRDTLTALGVAQEDVDTVTGVAESQRDEVMGR
jgi:hemoglobin